MLQLLRNLTLLFCIAASFAAKNIPATLMLGAGSSAYQIEGGWNAGGKGPSALDAYYHERWGANGDITADSYHKWQEDVDNVKNLGLDFYRILPNGTLNSINQAGVDYYLNLIKALKDAGIEPIVTLYHFDTAQHINLLGGVLNPQFVDYFENYVRLCYQLYGFYAKYWLTINEPIEVCIDGFGFGRPQPNLLGDGVYQCSYVVLKAHARAYRVYEEEFKSQYNGQVGIVINMEWREPTSQSDLDLEAQERGLQFSFGWFANPVFRGNWPQVMIDRIGNRSQLEGLARSRLPQFTQEEIEYINGTHDFFAFNTYGTHTVTYREDDPISYPNYNFDLGVDTGADTLLDPPGIGKLINFINDRYNPKAIIITENGCKTDDTLEDTERISFIKLNKMLQLLRNITLLVCIAASFAAKNIPGTLMLGAGSAAYQIEGGWDADGKGPSSCDVRYHEIGGENGDIAADSYHKWQEDVDNVRNLGLNFYRFSIAWSRILPNGTLNSINQAGVDYYRNLIKALKDDGVEPIVTLYHWDMPQHISLLGGFLNPQFVDYFEDYALKDDGVEPIVTLYHWDMPQHISLLGGFLNPQFVDYFEDYVRLCYQLYGSYVKYWLTINEPFEVCRDGFGYGSPPSNLVGDGIYQCSYVLLKSHARAYRVYDEEFRSQYNGQVGIVINTEWREPASQTDLDLEAQERGLQFSFGWFANPIFRGNWPQVMIDRIGNRSQLEGLARSRLPQFTQEEIEYINGTHDFFAFNTYGTHTVTYRDDDPISYPSYDFDLSVDTAADTLPDPLGMRRLINFINDRYKPKAIINTENGCTTDDTLEDAERIDFIKIHLSNIIDAITEDNINVIGYSVWSLMDSFEWLTYSNKMGLIRVDFDSPNRTRTWKDSAYWYQNVTATRTLDV